MGPQINTKEFSLMWSKCILSITLSDQLKKSNIKQCLQLGPQKIMFDGD